MIANGFAERVTDTARKGEQVWYLSHHGVYHPNKPGKPRVVFDCSSKYKGICLNDCLLPGPNITNTFPGVLFRFRRGLYAIQGDICSMFHRVGVSEHFCRQQSPSYSQSNLNQIMEVCKHKGKSGGLSKSGS